MTGSQKPVAPRLSCIRFSSSRKTGWRATNSIWRLATTRGAKAPPVFSNNRPVWLLELAFDDPDPFRGFHFHVAAAPLKVAAGAGSFDVRHRIDDHLTIQAFVVQVTTCRQGSRIRGRFDGIETVDFPQVDTQHCFLPQSDQWSGLMCVKQRTSPIVFVGILFAPQLVE